MMKPGNPCTAIGYVRVSTTEQRLGPRAQSEALEIWATREGVTLLAIFLDHGVSGATPVSERPGMVGAIAALASTGAGVLVASKRDRLARDPAVAGVIESQTRKAGATVRTADGTSDAKGSAGVLTKGMHDVLAAWEREVIRERTTAALAVKKARGEVTGQPPFGMRRSPDGVHMEPDSREQAVILRVRTLAGEGMSQRAIMRALASAGEVSRGGKPYSQTLICRMLHFL